MESQLITSAAQPISMYLKLQAAQLPRSCPMACVTVTPNLPQACVLAPQFPLSGLESHAWEVGEPSTSFRPPTSRAGPNGLAPTALPSSPSRVLPSKAARRLMAAVWWYLCLPRCVDGLSNVGWGCVLLWVKCEFPAGESAALASCCRRATASMHLHSCASLHVLAVYICLRAYELRLAKAASMPQTMIYRHRRCHTA